MKFPIHLARKLIPRSIRHGLQRFVNLSEFKAKQRAAANPLSSVERSEPSVDDASDSPPIGILRNRAQYHTQYITACREMDLPFRVIDLSTDDWQQQIKDSGCQIFMSWPDATQSPWAKLFKDRCRILEEVMGFSVYPNSKDMWMYEEKIRTREWLMAHGFPHPRTWIFTNKVDAKAFAESCELPIVFKTGFGAAAAGVQIVRTRTHLNRIIRRAFGPGHTPGGHDRRDKEWGRVFLQAYLPQVKEWRMVRIGESYFGHPKGQLGDFHSGSGKAEWDLPSDKLLNLLHEVTETGGFRSMDVDIFETPEGELYINELQTVFGASVSIDQMKKDGVAGRMIRGEQGAGSVGEEGKANVELRTLNFERRSEDEQPATSNPQPTTNSCSTPTPNNPTTQPLNDSTKSNVEVRTEGGAKGDGSADRRIGRGEGGNEEGKANFELRREDEQPATSNPQQVTSNQQPCEAPPPNPWIFEAGDFARNACCNLRIQDAICRYAAAPSARR